MRLEFGPEVQTMGVNLVNRSTEDYVPPKESFRAFTGGGNALGGGYVLNFKLLK